MQNSILFSLSALSQIIICLIIYYNSKGELDNSKKRLRLKFYLLSLTNISWCATQFAINLSLSVTLQERVFKFAVFATVWAAYFFLIFSRELIKYKAKSIRSFIELSLAISATIFTLPFSIAHVIVENQIVIYNYNVLLYSFVTFVPLIFVFDGIRTLERHSRKSTVVNTIEAKQIHFVSRGMFLTTVFAFSGNFVFSLIRLDATLLASLVVALAPAVFTISVGYAVFSLKLFNFRKFFVRVVIYGGVFTVIYGLFAIVVSLVTHKLFSTNNNIELVIFPATLIAYPLSALISTKILNIVDKTSRENEFQANKTIQEILRKIDTNDVLKGLSLAIKNEFILDTLVLAILTDDKSSAVKLVSNPIVNINSNLLEKLINNEADRQVVNQLVLNEYSLGDYQYGFIMNRDFIKGVILIGQKTDGRPIYDDEKLLLTDIANQSALALENSLQYDKIQLFNEELEQKIADATKELRKTNDKLKELDAAKDEFISMASHQLRTPLTSVKGYLSMVLEGDAGSITKQQKLMLDQAFVSSQRMVYLIADFLNVSRLKTGKFIIEPKPTFLPDLVAGELDQLYTTAKAKNLELSFDKPKQFPSLNLDETKTRQVVMNFVDNALHYTPEGGHVKVALDATDQSVNFTVSDDGIGVPISEQRHLFSKFFRAGNARKARPDGTGLGLFMAKKVIIAQGGAIIVKSQEGKGSTFGFTFPRAKLESPVITSKTKPKTT